MRAQRAIGDEAANTGPAIERDFAGLRGWDAGSSLPLWVPVGVVPPDPVCLCLCVATTVAARGSTIESAAGKKRGWSRREPTNHPRH